MKKKIGLAIFMIPVAAVLVGSVVAVGVAEGWVASAALIGFIAAVAGYIKLGVWLVD